MWSVFDSSWSRTKSPHYAQLRSESAAAQFELQPRRSMLMRKLHEIIIINTYYYIYTFIHIWSSTWAAISSMPDITIFNCDTQTTVNPSLGARACVWLMRKQWSIIVVCRTKRTVIIRLPSLLYSTFVSSGGSLWISVDLMLFIFDANLSSLFFRLSPASVLVSVVCVCVCASGLCASPCDQ